MLVTVSAALAIGQIWLLLLLIGCYKEIRQKEVQQLLEAALLKEKNNEERKRRHDKDRTTVM